MLDYMTRNMTRNASRMRYPQFRAQGLCVRRVGCRRSRVQGRDDWLDDQIEKYESKVAESERMYPIPIPARMGKIMLVNEKMDVSPTFEANKVRL